MAEEEETEKLICKEGPLIMPEPTLLEPSHQKKWKRNTLVGKIHITELKSFKRYHVIRDVSRAWTDAGVSNFKIMDLGHGMFGFQFEDEGDMKWVMDSRPWLVSPDKYNINEYLVLLTEWIPNTPPSDIEFSDSYPFWVQFHNIPYEYVSREMGKKIGEGTGHVVLDVDFDDLKSTRMKYLRVRVLVDITKKLATGCWLLYDKNKPNAVVWVSFKYEELPKICYRCGIIGHSKDRCEDEDESDDKDEDEDEEEDKTDDEDGDEDEEEDESDDEDGEEDDAIAVSYNPEGSCFESEPNTVLVEGQVLRAKGPKGRYGGWLYGDIDSDEEDEDEDYNEDDDEESESCEEDFEGLDDIEICYSE